ncbi:MAG: DUF488 domain-containing protein, partial [Thermoplasmata archaeon]
YWFRDLAPSNDLRRWYSHDPGKWEEFRSKYFRELDGNGKVKELLEICRRNNVIFLYSSKEREFNNAVALKEYVEEKLGT